MKNISNLILLTSLFSLLISCGGSKQTEQTEEIIVPKAAVKITSPFEGSIENQLVLNGKTVFLKKNQVVAPISGYITAVHVNFGDKVQEGSIMFEMQTRENKAFQMAGQSDTNFGKITVQATTSGTINEPITLGVGAYIVEGTPLCNLVDNNDLLVQVNVPYENHNLIKKGMLCRLFLPDNTQIEGSVSQIRPFINETSQTQEVLIKPAGSRPLPENMNLTAAFINSEKTKTLLLPKKAILTNETQDEFWVMKIIQDSIAVMVPIEPGIKNDSLVEIRSADLTLDDIIILEGGYGLEDSSLVNIVR
jgi:multidrug efflux pump subunit AcrA (membrane-fusion protein)